MMRNWMIWLGLTLGALGTVCTTAGAATHPPVESGVAWVKPVGTDIESVFAQAKASNKPVFLYWGAVWCPPCNQIKATVFNRRDFIDRSQLFVPVYLDGDTPGAQQLGARFKVRGYPTMILFKADGSEITRLPGEVDARTYVNVLELGLASGGTAKEALTLALQGGTLSASQWRLLAYYSWDQDEAQLLPKGELTHTLERLARACPASLPALAQRLQLKTLVAAAQEKTAVPDAKNSLAQVQSLLRNPAQVQLAADVLTYYATDIVSVLAAGQPAAKPELLRAFQLALDRLAVAPGLATSERLGTVQAKVHLAKVDSPPGTPLPQALLRQVRLAAAQANKAARSGSERQAIVPNAADLLSEAGLLDQSDALLLAELPQAISPYYHMLVLASNAKTRGDTQGALHWARKAWERSEGPATRLQWGAGYVNRLIEMAPTDEDRIAKAAQQVLAELEPVPETFYERNQRTIERMAQRLQAWARQGQRQGIVNALRQQLEAKCALLPTAHEGLKQCQRAWPGAPA